MQGASISRTHQTLSWHEWEKKRPRPEPSAAVFGSQVVLKRLSGTGSVWKSMVCLGRPSLQQKYHDKIHQNTIKKTKNIKQKLYILRSFKKSIEAIACNRQLIQQYQSNGCSRPCSISIHAWILDILSIVVIYRKILKWSVKCCKTAALRHKHPRHLPRILGTTTKTAMEQSWTGNGENLSCVPETWSTLCMRLTLDFEGTSHHIPSTSICWKSIVSSRAIRSSKIFQAETGLSWVGQQAKRRIFWR